MPRCLSRLPSPCADSYRAITSRAVHAVPSFPIGPLADESPTRQRATPIVRMILVCTVMCKRLVVLSRQEWLTHTCTHPCTQFLLTIACLFFALLYQGKTCNAGIASPRYGHFGAKNSQKWPKAESVGGCAVGWCGAPTTCHAHLMGHEAPGMRTGVPPARSRAVYGCFWPVFWPVWPQFGPVLGGYPPPPRPLTRLRRGVERQPGAKNRGAGRPPLAKANPKVSGRYTYAFICVMQSRTEAGIVVMC